MSTLVPIFFFVQVVHWICFLLDDILFPNYRDISIREPVFVIGTPRSGTSFLHRILSKDTETFTTFKLWELIFAPSITERKIWMMLGRLDRILGGPGRRFIADFDHQIHKNARKIHRISLFEPEEDELVLLTNFSSVFLSFMFPFSEKLRPLYSFDLKTPPDEKQRIMRFYKTCLQRHLYFHGTDRRFLSKNPVFSSKIDALKEFFPDARIVCCVRNPYNAIPSLLSLLTASWRRFHNDLKGHIFRDDVLRMVLHWYRHPIDRLQSMTGDHSTFLTYDSLAQDIRKAIGGIYDQFGLQISPAFRRQLATELQKSRAYKSEHIYSLEEFSLTPEQILGDFEDVFEYHKFNTDCSILDMRLGRVKEMR
jgi:hypothetical protein